MKANPVNPALLRDGYRTEISSNVSEVERLVGAPAGAAETLARRLYEPLTRRAAPERDWQASYVVAMPPSTHVAPVVPGSLAARSDREVLDALTAALDAIDEDRTAIQDLATEAMIRTLSHPEPGALVRPWFVEMVGAGSGGAREPLRIVRRFRRLPPQEPLLALLQLIHESCAFARKGDWAAVVLGAWSEWVRVAERRAGSLDTRRRAGEAAAALSRLTYLYLPIEDSAQRTIELLERTVACVRRLAKGRFSEPTRLVSDAVERAARVATRPADRDSLSALGRDLTRPAVVVR